MAKICLDAGHYGDYNRSPAVPEYYESRMNWKLHLLLKKELEALGVEVITTRADEGKDLPLESRGKASKGCDLFLSLHSNAAGSGIYEDIDYVVGFVMLDGSSDALGTALSNKVAEIMGTTQKPRVNTREGKNGEYYGVLRGAASVGTPGIILEHSFHTQTRATRWLMAEENLKKLAKAEAQVIAEHFGVKPADTPAPTVDCWYRIRKSWADKDSQLGAYRELANARTACPEGYTVYDWEGNGVYSVSAKTFELTFPRLSYGNNGDAVEALQVLLTHRGYSCGKAGIDGIFGTDTQKAVAAYQMNCEIPSTGILDQQTMARLLGI